MEQCERLDAVVQTSPDPFGAWARGPNAHPIDGVGASKFWNFEILRQQTFGTEEDLCLLWLVDTWWKPEVGFQFTINGPLCCAISYHGTPMNKPLPINWELQICKKKICFLFLPSILYQLDDTARTKYKRNLSRQVRDPPLKGRVLSINQTWA